MKISIICNPVFSGWSPLDIRLGGTERSIVEWAQAWSIEHEVTVYKNGPELIHDGVTYLDRNKFVTGDVTLNVKSPDYPYGHYFTNETDASRLDLRPFKSVIWPSRWAKDHIPVSNDNVWVVPHGYDPKTYYPDKKIPKSVLYSSSPDRGLDTLLDIWPDVVAIHPDAYLAVTYGAPERDVPNTLFLGNTDEATMAELYRSSDVWCHPCNGGELFGIAAVQAQASGCVPVYFPTMALTETVKAGMKSTRDTLTSDLIETLGNPKRKANIRKQLLDCTFPTWHDTAKTLIDGIFEIEQRI